MGKKAKVVVFDFDGTLTTNDTLIAFIRFACGDAAFLWGFLLHLPLLVLMKLRLYDNGKTKERVFRHFFRGWTEERFNQTCEVFAANHRHLLRQQTVDILRQAQRDGARVLIVTASIDRWVQPFFPDVEVLGTKVEVIPLPTSPKGMRMEMGQHRHSQERLMRPYSLLLRGSWMGL